MKKSKGNRTAVLLAGTAMGGVVGGVIRTHAALQPSDDIRPESVAPRAVNHRGDPFTQFHPRKETKIERVGRKMAQRHARTKAHLEAKK